MEHKQKIDVNETGRFDENKTKSKQKRNNGVYSISSIEATNERKENRRENEDQEELKKGIDASITFFRCVLKDSMVDRIEFG